MYNFLCHSGHTQTIFLRQTSLFLVRAACFDLAGPEFIITSFTFSFFKVSLCCLGASSLPGSVQCGRTQTLSKCWKICFNFSTELQVVFCSPHRFSLTGNQFCRSEGFFDTNSHFFHVFESAVSAASLRKAYCISPSAKYILSNLLVLYLNEL